MRRNHSLLGIMTTAVMCAAMLPLSANAGERFDLNGGGQRKGVSDGYSYELWIDNTGGSGSMTLGNGGAFDTEWKCEVPQGNFLARRGMDFAKDNKNALDYGTIQLDYDASYTASAAGNSRLCVYGWFAEKTAPVTGSVVEYYIIEDWKNWCPKPDGQSTTVNIDGADYEVFRIKHTGPTIRNGGGSETFWQYFSIRKSKRTSGTITVSDHFNAWKKAGFEIYDLDEVALNAEGWESSGSAKVSKLEMTVGGEKKETEPPKPTEPPTEPADGIYMKEDFSSGAGDWTGRGGAKTTVSDGALSVSGRSDNWHGAAVSLDNKTYIPGNAYSFSVMGKAASADTLKLTLQYTVDGKENYDNVAEITAPAGQWVQLANTSYTIPAGASDMILYVEADSKTGDFAIDDATIATKGTKIAASGKGSTNPTDPKEPTQPNGGGTPGDVNNDTSIGVTDIVTMQKFLLGKNASITGANADLNGDGVIDIFDLGLLKRMILKNGGKDVKAETPTEPVTEKPTEAQGAHLSMKEFTAKCQAMMANNETEDSKQEKAGVQYGTIKQGTYFSSTCNREKPYNILLPAGYDESKKYPVLYCMHGYYENQNRMIIKGNGTMYTRQIIGNAIASGEAKDMIVVFPYIYSSATQKDCTGMDAANNAAYDNFINDLTKDLMPHIEKTYSVKTGKDNTAITGFSMGGRESLAIGMGLSDKFGYVGAICPAPGVDDAYKGGWKFESGKEPYLIMITAGGNDTVVYDTPKPYHEKLEKNGVPHIWHYYQAGYHGDNSIHAHLYNFCRFAFQN